MRSFSVQNHRNIEEKRSSQLMWLLLALLIFVFGFLLWGFYQESIQDIDQQTQALLQLQVVGLENLGRR